MIKNFISSFIKITIITLAVIFITIYICSITQVIGNSMNDTLKNNDILILNKFKYRFFEVRRRDIVAFLQGDSKYLIKRVIGLPSENVIIKNNKVYINGRCLKEKYLKEGMIYDDFDVKDIGYETIPKDMYLVLGDNRENSEDSRIIGLIKKEDIVGKIDFRIWPINKLKIFK